MATIILPSRWRRSPPPGRQVQFSHPLAHRLWGAGYFANGSIQDAIRKKTGLIINDGNVDQKSRVYRGGRYRTLNRPGGAPPYFYGNGRNTIPATGSVTLLALLGGDGRATFPTVRAKVSTVYWQAGMPEIIEGDGSTNRWTARVTVTGGTAVTAVGTSPAGQYDPGQVVVAVYRNGIGVEVWVDGRLEGSAGSSLNLNLSPTQWYAASGTTIIEFPPIILTWDRGLSDGEIRALSENPFQVLKPERRVSFFDMSGGGVPTLVIEDITHAHPVDAVALGQVHQLAVQEATHGQSVDGIAVTQTHQLAVDEATHAHPVDSPVLHQAHQLTVSDTLHGHAVDTLDLTQVHQLVVQDATHAHPTDAIALTQQHLIAVEDCLHQHALDHLNLSGVVSLAIQDILHGHAADGLVLGGSSTLQISDVLHAHAADAVALGQVHVLVVSDAIHAQLVDAVALSLPGAVLAGERALVIPTETRALVVVAETRALAIAAEVRALTIH